MVIGGVKVNDKRACCPITKRRFADSIDTKRCGGVQSRNTCFPLQIMIGKETKANFPYFSPLFAFMDKCGECSCESVPSVPFLFLINLGWKNFDVATNCDMAATWRGTAKSGGAKVKRCMCHCCSILNGELITPNKHKCARYCQGLHADDAEWKCYHRSIEDERNLPDWMTELEDLKAKLQFDLNQVEKSKMSCEKTDNCDADRVVPF